jgi:membrane-associated phospholipid phosphatase
VAGFVTYHIYPAAPPWYYHSHGCVVDLGASASAGPNLARVDELLGVHYFTAFYGRSNDVFGAIPSLHVAYPLLIVMEGWRHHRWLLRSVTLLYFSMMCFAAVYLDHHWLIDVIVGLGYGVGVYAAMSWVFRRERSPGPARAEAPKPEVSRA